MDTDVAMSKKALKVVLFRTEEWEAAFDRLMDQICALPTLKISVSKPHAFEVIRDMLTAIIQRRRAWVYGEEAAIQIHANMITSVITFNLDYDERKAVWAAVEADAEMNLRVSTYIRSLIAFVTDHMSRNLFAIHDVAYDNRTKTWALSEFADWRAVQWTKDQIRLIDESHEDI